jgi:hypothetical protein
MIATGVLAWRCVAYGRFASTRIVMFNETVVSVKRITPAFCEHI